MLKILISLSFFFALSACGQKGGLYYPQEPQPVETQNEEQAHE